MLTATGYSAAINQLAYGAPPGLGPGDACGRCFALTATQDPFSPSYPGPFNTIIVKVTDLCPISGNEEWCGQTTSKTNNAHGMPFHFDICTDTGGAAAFFPQNHGALLGTFQETVDPNNEPMICRFRAVNGPVLMDPSCSLEVASMAKRQLIGRLLGAGIKSLLQAASPFNGTRGAQVGTELPFELEF
ncbi:hypothetical protein D9758_006070 [Tetrapyrgos nigripes]|uniref:Expansin n=1 Tax=Tetrapyrgos nigripes TaxID=182062 RepID=A0A8H5D870_9AGAR|nr:hypothetical protein D9758_006070 [Tetrapyrgos nigripes]